MTEESNGLNFTVEGSVERTEEDEITINLNIEGEIDLEALLLYAYPHLKPQYAEFDTLTPHLFPIVVGALIDARITDMISALLIEGTEVRSLLGADGLGYKDRVRLAVATGLLPQTLAKPLYSIGYIRNHFAHRAAASLTDAEIDRYAPDLVKELVKFLYADSADDHELSDILKKAKAAYIEDAEEMARGALKTSWLLFMTLTDATIARTKRLEYVAPEPKVIEGE